MEQRAKLLSTNLIERLVSVIKRRTDVVRLTLLLSASVRCSLTLPTVGDDPCIRPPAVVSQ